MIEIHLEKGVSLLGLFPPNGARQDFGTAGTMTKQMKAIAVAKIAINCNPESQTRGLTKSGFPGGRSTVKLCDA